MLLRRPQPRQSESPVRRRRVVGTLCVMLVLGVAGWTAYGQWGEDRRSRGMGQFPRWELDKEMPRDVFTFARVIYNSPGGGGGWGRGYGRRGRGDWATDYPEAEENLAYRLKEMTSMKVHPNGVAVELTDPELFNYPFIYMVEPGRLQFQEAEVVALRKYLLNGGFLMVDDFWGEYEWRNFYSQIKRVFPDREPQELPIDHPIFSCVFPLKEKPQIPNMDQGTKSQYTGITWERPDAREPHYRALFDDKGRMMSIICHNTDLGDGWEREGYNYYYFREFSEKKAYPLGINILFYAMTQ